MQKWEHLLVHVEFSEGKLVVIANGKEVIKTCDSTVEVDFIKYLNSLGADGWEMFSAQKDELGYQFVFFKHSIE